MQVQIFALFTLLFVVQVTNQQECQLGQIRYDSCNFCRCTKNGHWLCSTNTQCNHYNWLKIAQFRLPQMTSWCQPGESVQVECNTCTCANDGLWVCTRKFCHRKECQPGQWRRQDCNVCICTETGVWMCTEIGCQSKSHVSTKDCNPGEQRQIACNTCYCSQYKQWLCTVKVCKSVDSSLIRLRRGVPVAADLKNTPCAPNDYFTIDCNTCYCNIDKTGYLCTENLCPIVDSVTTKIENTTIRNDETTAIIEEQQNTNSTNS